MLSRKRNSLVLLCLLFACCQKIDPTTAPEEADAPDEAEGAVAVLGTGEGTKAYPYTVADIRSSSLSSSEAVWVIGYMVGTARLSMGNAVFTADATNQSNILLSSDSLCNDTARCIPVELSSDKWRQSLSLPANAMHFRKCLLVKAIPSPYLHRKGLRSVSAGLWLDGFDISSVAPQEWDVIDMPTSSQK